ncbi:MAG: energy-coupling factor ABC transporter ATP-binding protein [Proteobacteria bacterium]|nr:ABC transporter ATP-binding protein [Desulfobacula sp.]MBU3954542.1 energy-coupling factor ABC transporter ATP-binding protein [Pseudomonadota bacterium]MBU4133115.1 energy-coupling factor ABC transporter ATP-binding protein [Pseudomonadota bacterium]
MTSPLLETQHLTHRYPDGDGGIFDINFSISKGEFIILAGKNGSGKTTLIRHLNGLLLPQKGEIRLYGKNILKDLTLTRKTVGMVFQDADTQIVGDTVFDEVAFGPENLNQPRNQINTKVIAVLEQLDLIGLKDRNPATLSGGEKRRLAIAGILAMDPEIIIFDEPFANLDHPGSQSLLATISDLNQKGQAIIMATHDVESVLKYASRMLIMADGRLAEDGSVTDLVKKLEFYGVKEPCACKIAASFSWQP